MSDSGKITLVLGFVFVSAADRRLTLKQITRSAETSQFEAGGYLNEASDFLI